MTGETCPHCGKTMGADGRYCEHCGATRGVRALHRFSLWRMVGALVLAILTLVFGAVGVCGLVVTTQQGEFGGSIGWVFAVPGVALAVLTGWGLVRTLRSPKPEPEPHSTS